MSITKVFYSIASELYEVLHILYGSPSRKVCREVALTSLLLFIFSALYGSVASKVVVILTSILILTFLSHKNLKELIHIYIDLMIFVLSVTLPAIVVTCIALGNIGSLFITLLSTIVSVISVSTVAIAITTIVGVDQIVEMIQGVSKTFATIFMLMLTVTPKIVLYIAMLTLARISRTIKPRRLYILEILMSSLGDTILLSSSISYQTLLAIKSRTIAETRYRRFRTRPKALDCVLLLLSLSMAVMVYLRWI